MSRNDGLQVQAVQHVADFFKQPTEMKTPTSTASLDDEPFTGIPPHKQPAQKQRLMKNEGERKRASEREGRPPVSRQKKENKQNAQEMERRGSFEKCLNESTLPIRQFSIFPPLLLSMS